MLLLLPMIYAVVALAIVAAVVAPYVAFDYKHRARRTGAVVRRIAIGIGIAAVVAGIVVALWPQAPSDCHGGPECSIGALGELGQWILGGMISLAGMIWLVFVPIVFAIHQGVQKRTRATALPRATARERR